MTGARTLLIVLCAGAAVTACERKPEPVKAPVVAVDPDALPVVDAPPLQARMAPEQTLAIVTFPRDGETTIADTVRGWRVKVYAVPVARGQTLKVVLKADSPNIYVNVGDAADKTGAALHRGDVDGREASVTAKGPTVYFVAPFQPEAMARRADQIPYSLTFTRGPAA